MGWLVQSVNFGNDFRTNAAEWLEAHCDRRVGYVFGSGVVLTSVVWLGKRLYTRRRVKKLQEKLKLEKASLLDELKSDSTVCSMAKTINNLSGSKFLAFVRDKKNDPTTIVRAMQLLALLSNENTNAVTQVIKVSSVSLDGVKDKPLAGMPISLKECVYLEGTETTAGLSCLVGKNVNHKNGDLVNWLLENGAIPHVKTNIPQCMLAYESKNPIYGETKNPYDLTRGPGGSSSGEGALIAGKGSFVGVGTDIAGSVRVPANFCGIFSLRPTSTRFLSRRNTCFTWLARANITGFSTTGFMSSDVGLLIEMHRLLYCDATFTRYPGMIPIPWREDYFTGDEGWLNGRQLTIGVFVSDGLNAISEPVRRAVKLAKASLKDCDYKMVDYRPPKLEELLGLFCECLYADNKEIYSLVAQDITIESFNKQATFWNLYAPNALKHVLAFLVAPFVPKNMALALRKGTRANSVTEVNRRYRALLAYRQLVLDDMVENGLDAILCPVTGVLPMKLGATGPIPAVCSAFCGLFNVLDWPAGVIPVTKVTEAEANKPFNPQIYGKMAYFRAVDADHAQGIKGLPVGVQIASTPCREELVLKIMKDCFENLPSTPKTQIPVQI